MEEELEFDRLISLGESVIATRRPPPPMVMGRDRIDRSLFSEWRSSSIALLERLFEPLGSLPSEFRLQTASSHAESVEHGLGILRAARSEARVRAAGDSRSSPGDGSGELFIRGGRPHDAYIELRRIFHETQESIIVIDPYLDGSVLSLLGAIETGSLQVELLSWKLPSDFSSQLELFRKQYPAIEIELRTSREFHDRFLILDGKNCYHVGASIKDAGGRAFMISRVEDSANVNAIITAQDKAWNEAEIANSVA